jgi:hypothetical protein
MAGILIRPRWTQQWDIAVFPASNSCVQITPDESNSYTEDDPLPEARSMANLLFLPDGRILCLNGAGTGERFFVLKNRS